MSLEIKFPKKTLEKYKSTFNNIDLDIIVNETTTKRNNVLCLKSTIPALTVNNADHYYLIVSAWGWLRYYVRHLNHSKHVTQITWETYFYKHYDNLFEKLEDKSKDSKKKFYDKRLTQKIKWKHFLMDLYLEMFS